MVDENGIEIINFYRILDVLQCFFFARKEKVCIYSSLVWCSLSSTPVGISFSFKQEMFHSDLAPSHNHILLNDDNEGNDRSAALFPHKACTHKANNGE